MVSPLDRKLLRDLWRMKGQAVAIGAVIGVGVLMLVMMTGLVASLSETRRAYYERYRLADVFAPAARAPERLVARLAAIPGVSAAEGRVTGSALIHLPDWELPVQAMAVSLPDRGAPALNDIYLNDGRLLDGGHSDDILLLHSFSKAHGLRPGDRLNATMNGARRSFRIVGLVMAPEFLFTTAPGELAPDDRRFGVIWMSRAALSAAYDMEGAFNEALLSLSRGADEPAVLDAVDQLLSRYGGQGAYGLVDQFSNRVITEEIDGLKAGAVVVPPIFLAVAAFLLYIVITRMVQSEREEIGLIKGFGYTNAEVGLHYFKLVLAIATGGALAGCLGGILAGRGLIGIYAAYYKFPFLVFQLSPASFITGVTVSILAASAGGMFVLRRVFALTPAEAMHPPAPADFSRTGRIGSWLIGPLDQPSRMVFRRVTRQPMRMAGAVLGIALGMGLSQSMLTIYAGFDSAIETTFSVVDRSDVSVTFTHPVSDKTLFELRRMPGVIHAEPARQVSVVLRNGPNSHRGAITGLPRGAALSRAVDDQGRAVEMPKSGLVLSSALAGILKIRPGEILTVELREGAQPVIQIPVAGVAQTWMGAPAFMDLSALNRALSEPHRVSGAYLDIDESYTRDIVRALRDMPTVAGFSRKSDAHDALVKLMNTGAGAMRYVMGVLAFVITFGIIYNAARIAYAERLRDLASLRVLGFTRGEAGFVLLGELGVVTLLALPLGGLLGYYLAIAIAEGFSTELYQVPAIFFPRTYGAAMVFVLVAAVTSGWIVKRDLDRADLVQALKTRE